jgi:hypothetical protein
MTTQFQVNQTTVTLVKGDITAQATDAIVTKGCVSKWTLQSAM